MYAAATTQNGLAGTGRQQLAATSPDHGQNREPHGSAQAQQKQHSSIEADDATAEVLCRGLPKSYVDILQRYNSLQQELDNAFDGVKHKQVGGTQRHYCF